MKNKSKLEDLTYKRFQDLAKDKTLSSYEKIGFFDSLPKGKEYAIIQDILNTMPNLHKKSQVVVDIGCRCSDLPFLLIEQCKKHTHPLILIDSKEMLNHLPD